jgi:hypothetical protein
MAGGAISGGPSLHGAGRACLERARRRQPANRRGMFRSEALKLQSFFLAVVGHDEAFS